MDIKKMRADLEAAMDRTRALRAKQWFKRNAAIQALEEELSKEFGRLILDAEAEEKRLKEALDAAKIAKGKQHPRIGEVWHKWRREKTRWNGAADPDSPWVLSGEVAVLEAWNGVASNANGKPWRVGELCLRVLKRDGKPSQKAYKLGYWDADRYYPEGVSPDDADRERRWVGLVERED